MTGKRFICPWPLLSKFPFHRKELQKLGYFLFLFLYFLWDDLDKAG